MTTEERTRALEAERLTGMPRWHIGPPLTPHDLAVRCADVRHQMRDALAQDERARSITAYVEQRQRVAS